MDDDVKRRPYASPTRRARSEATRARILDAAAGLFVAGGYAGTSTRTIAAAAGASEASVFANFGSKSRLLAAVIVDRVTSDGDFPLSRNHALTGTPSRGEAVAVLAGIARRGHEPSWRLLAAGAAAAADDPELAAAMRHGAERRLADIAWFVRSILGIEDDADRIAEGIWAVGAVEGYRHLVVDQGWPVDEYESWLARMILATADAR
ncbi:TetR/AcrR family transcriptional regulator [Microbacterium capsulatum]|uniref:TetR/AcrR family transcriptional regulator n=1 Tax=Microbacterium capsulatum TaxID=3041921 RepID=A0ABU0XGH8_9MICO|nr:TetR/AcrR family transcriptional regulator [Microbacterium sp. ASV81]MDQ4214229.1 TetR/AcrR family transcriptional regulator [Microbacterium sp. ASV81]